jgi:hypothetical protein
MRVEIELEIGYTITVDGSAITVSDGKNKITLPEDPEQRESVMEALRVAQSAAQRQDQLTRRAKSGAC